MAGAPVRNLGHDAAAAARIGIGGGQRRSGQAFVRGAEVEHQRRQRVGLRRGRQFDLAARSECAPARNQAGDQFADAGQQVLPVGGVITFTLADQGGKQRVAAAFGFACPDQVVPGDKVGKISAGEIGECRFAFAAEAQIEVVQVPVTGEGRQHGGMIAEKAGI